MKINLVGIITLAVVVVGIDLGCVDNEKSLVIVYNVAPDTSCAWKPQSTGTEATIYSEGLLDLKDKFDYTLWPQVENYMLNNFSASSEDLNAMAVQVDYVEISYSWLYGNTIIESHAGGLADIENQEPYRVPKGVTIASGSNTGESGKLVMPIGVLKPGLGSLLATLGDDMKLVTLGVHIQIHGHTLGGTKVTSNKFVYPINFCLGCTVGKCCEGTTKEGPMIFCSPGQDGPQPCSC